MRKPYLESCLLVTLATFAGAFTSDSAALIDDIKTVMSVTPTTDANEDILVPNRRMEDVTSAMNDFSADQGPAAWNFLRGVAQSETFVRDHWQKRPFLIRARDTGGWVQGCFTIERDLKRMDESFITGFKTAEILRNGTKTDTWALSPLKEDPMQRTKWSDVEEALNGGTIYFNTAGGLWKNLGGLCRLVGYAFGLPPNVNVYCTPPSCSLSVPLHTDKQDVFVFQSQGAKRWRVYAPPPRSRNKDPLNRGKNGDVLTFEELSDQPLIDTVIQPGDVLYIPIGFPHTTDTATPVDGVDESVFQEASVHLTMGLDTHVWFLAIAHLRWTLLQRCNTTFHAELTDDALYWRAMGSLPFGFLGGQAWRSTIKSMNEGHGLGTDFKTMVADQLRDILVGMEPTRWKDASEGDYEGTESLPSKEQIDEAIEFVVTKHWKGVMETQEELHKDVDATEEESLLKTFRGTQDQNQIMEDFGWFSNNRAFAESYRSRRLRNEQLAQMAAFKE